MSPSSRLLFFRKKSGLKHNKTTILTYLYRFNTNMTNTGTYFSRLRELVALELKEEQESYRRSLEEKGASLTGTIHEPVCRYPIHLGNNAYNPMGQLTVELRYEIDEDEVELEFEPGKPVTLFYLTDGANGVVPLQHQCYVEAVGDGVMSISLPSKAALQSIRDLGERHLLGVQLGVDNTSFRVMQESLAAAEHKEDERFVHLREVLLGNAKPAFRTLPQLSFPWLNPSQNDAIQKVVEAQEVAIVHGPPGTGKTTTLVEAIYETLRRENQVLVCAQSNMAVDWIAEKLTDRGVSVLRIGNPTRVTDKMLSFTYERRFENHPLYDQLWAVRKAIRDIYASKSGSSDSRHQKIARLRDRATELEYTIREAIFSDTKVVACTLTGSANHLLDGMKFGTLFIDEAAQALEAACWIAIQKVHRVILAGDHRQLPPTIKSPEAMRGGLDRTLMQYIVEQKPQAVSLLRVQYRMADDIMQFPNREFYDGMLISAPEVKYRGILDWDTAVEWRPSSLPDSVNEGLADRTGEESGGVGSFSYFNVAEAQQTLQTLHDYFERIGKERIMEERIDVGIISPYKGQVSLLRRMLRQDKYWKPYRSLITVNTVDGFQGQERDVIVISLVRSNEEGNIGFLRDLRRMNVAITRARMKLIIIGDRTTLCRHPFYRHLAEYVDEIVFPRRS